MAKRSSGEKLVKVTLNLVAEDYQMIQDYYAASGAALAIRQILAQHCLKMKARLAQAATVVPEIELAGDEI